MSLITDLVGLHIITDLVGLPRNELDMLYGTKLCVFQVPGILLAQKCKGPF